MARLEAKSADERVSNTFDWAPLLGENDQIASSAVTVTGVDLVSETHDGTSVTIVLEGGTNGTVARIVNTITTQDGLVETEAFILPISLGEPVSVPEAKSHLRVDGQADDANISGLIVAAREWVEDYTGLILTPREVTETLDSFRGELRLRAWPINTGQPVTVQYLDGNRVMQTVPDTVIRTEVRPGLLWAPAPWPHYSIPRSIAVTFNAGFPDPASIPQVLKQAMLLMLTAFYEDREGGDTFAKAEETAKKLSRRYKRRPL